MQRVATPQADDDDHPRLNIFVSLAHGGTFETHAASGFRLMEIIRASGLPIKVECGGAGVCSTGHVRVPQRWLDLLLPPSEEELARLDEIPTADDASRLVFRLRHFPPPNGEVESKCLRHEEH